MIITISGLPGSGKSTIGKMLAQKLGYKYYSIGDLRGKLALERGLTIDELNALGEKEDWTDKEVDNYQRELGQSQDNFVMDGRLAFHFIPQAFKIFLTVDPAAAAQRVFQTPRPDEERASSPEELQKHMAQRIQSDKRRYQKYYGLSLDDLTQFDVVLDTTRLTPDQIIARLLSVLKKPVGITRIDE